MNKEMAKLMESRTPLVEQCTLVESPKDGDPDGPTKVTFCSRADGSFCGAYAWPAKKWRSLECPLSDAFLRTKTKEVVEWPSEKTRVGQQKQKKSS